VYKGEKQVCDHYGRPPWSHGKNDHLNYSTRDVIWRTIMMPGNALYFTCIYMYVFPEFLFTLTLLFTFIRVTFINDSYSSVAFGDHDTSNRKYCSKNTLFLSPRPCVIVYIIAGRRPCRDVRGMLPPHPTVYCRCASFVYVCVCVCVYSEFLLIFFIHL